MKCLLHIGMHKTGTTAIQSALQHYDDGDSFYARLGEPNHSIPIVSAISKRQNWEHWHSKGLTEAEIVRKAEAARATLLDQLSRRDRKRIVISGEEISMLPRPDAENLIACIREYCDDITALIYVRDPAEFATSAFQQMVKGGFRTAVRSVHPLYGFRIKKFRDLLGPENLIVRNYARSVLKGGDAVTDFCAVVGLDAARAGPQEPNEAMPADALRWLFLFNQTSPLYQGHPYLGRAYHRLHQTLNAAFRGGAQPPKEVFGDLAVYDECDWLAAEFDISFTPPGDFDASSRDGENRVAQWLADFPPDATTRLLEILSSKGVDVRFRGDRTKLITMLFYLCLRETAVEELSPSSRIARVSRRLFG